MTAKLNIVLKLFNSIAKEKNVFESSLFKCIIEVQLIHARGIVFDYLNFTSQENCCTKVALFVSLRMQIRETQNHLGWKRLLRLSSPNFD